MAIDRRHALGLLAGAVAAGPRLAHAAGTLLYLSARSDDAGGTFLSAFSADGQRVYDIGLPARGHAFAWSAPTGHAVAFGRRPGAFAVVLDAVSGKVLRTVPNGENRHFNGHGVFAPDGGMLYATEYDFAGQRGLIGVYDVNGGYVRVAEYETRGLDPHDMRLLEDGTTLAVANGGILTDPILPGLKLNVPTMDPSLVYLDRRDGTMIGQYRLAPSLHQLSIRHLAVGHDGTLAVAMQYEGPPDDAVPLVALHDGRGELRPLAVAEDVRRAMRQYSGSAAVDTSGLLLGVTCPKGGVATFWDFASGSLLATTGVADGCGIAAAPEAGRFLVTSGVGGAVDVEGRTGTASAIVSEAMDTGRWDNHVLALHA